MTTMIVMEFSSHILEKVLCDFTNSSLLTYLILIQELINKYQDDLTKMFAKSPKKPRGSMAEMDKTIKYVIATNTHTLSLSLCVFLSLVSILVCVWKAVAHSRQFLLQTLYLLLQRLGRSTNSNQSEPYGGKAAFEKD